MKRFIVLPAALLIGVAGPLPAQQFFVGNRLGLPINPAADGAFEPISSNVKVYDAVSFINHDGSVHTARWIGVQSPADRGNLTPPLVLNEPYGSDIVNGMLYVADRDSGTTATEPSAAVIRRFSMQTGAPAGETRVERSAWLNDIEVADDGTVYATQTGDRDDNPDPATWQ